MAFIKNEFKLENFKLDYDDPDLFLSSRWQERYTVSKAYLAFRWVLALYHVGWIVYLFLSIGGVDASFARHTYYFIYLTDWAYIALTLLNVVWAINMTRGYFKYKKEGYVTNGVGFALQLQWTLQNIAFMPAMVVSLIFWLALYTPEQGISAANTEAHIMNTIFVVLDIFVSASPIRLLHFYQPLSFLTIYAIFSIIYYVAGGVNGQGDHAIYPVLDWEKPGETLVFLAGTAVVAILFQVFTWILFVIREQIYTWSVKTGTVGTFHFV